MSWITTAHGGELLAITRGNRVSIFSQKIAKVLKMHEFDLEWFEYDSGMCYSVLGLTFRR